MGGRGGRLDARSKILHLGTTVSQPVLELTVAKDPQKVLFFSPDPCIAFFKASASFSGSKLFAGFSVPRNSG